MPTVSVPNLTGDDPVRHLRLALEAIDEINSYSTNENITIDLRNAEWFTPAFTAPLSVVYNQRRHSNTSFQFLFPPNMGMRTYLNQINFPEGSDDPSEDYTNHLPLCLLNTDSDGDAIDTVGTKIKALLEEHFPSLDAGQVHGIHYPISEIIDNVDQHSGCDCGAVLVQNYPSKQYLDICIVDDGISIPGRFSEYGSDYSTDADAILQALNGESTREDVGHRHRGFGLQSTVDLVCEGLNGQCILMSRGAGYRLRDGNDPMSILNRHSWDGTIFVARLDLPEDDFNIIDYVTP